MRLCIVLMLVLICQQSYANTTTHVSTNNKTYNIQLTSHIHCINTTQCD